MFYSCGDVTITGKGLQILTYARHSWTFSSEPSDNGDLQGPVAPNIPQAGEYPNGLHHCRGNLLIRSCSIFFNAP